MTQLSDTFKKSQTQADGPQNGSWEPLGSQRVLLGSTPNILNISGGTLNFRAIGETAELGYNIPAGTDFSRLKTIKLTNIVSSFTDRPQSALRLVSNTPTGDQSIVKRINGSSLQWNLSDFVNIDLKVVSYIRISIESKGSNVTTVTIGKLTSTK